ncbi:MAG: N-6 DNA methylase [Kineosporiaceae bacterium]
MTVAAVPPAVEGSLRTLPGGTVDDASARKARGAFFTPPALCAWMTEWALRGPGDAVLEPSCGEAAFLTAAAHRLAGLGGGSRTVPRLHGVELHGPSAEHARRLVDGATAGARVDVAVTTSDFFDVPPRPVYDVVLGNPPFVRYQDFSGEARAKAREAALAAGVRLSALASSWAAFVVHATRFLAPGGRLALVLPAELLSVNYAAGVRDHLMRTFAHVKLVLFTERVFPGVLEEVVLLLAEGQGPTDHCELVQVRDVAELLTVDPRTAQAADAARWRPASPRGKWTPAMLAAADLDAYDAALAGEGVTTLSAWGETSLGGVTGNNRYFTLTQAQAEQWGLQPGRDLTRISPPGSRHLRGLDLGRAAWTHLADAARPVWLFRPGTAPSPQARAYLAHGEQLGVPDAYKCRVRTPWWRTPLPGVADLLLTCMNADTPRLVGNGARVHHLNSVHGVYLRDDVPEAARRLLPVAALTSLTLLGAETVGRAYGGGMLKLEPGEADHLPLPTPAAVLASADELAAARPRVADALAGGRLLDAVALVDAVLLGPGNALGVDPVAAPVLARARAGLAARRHARGTSKPPAAVDDSGVAR